MLKGGLLLPNKNEKETFLSYLDNSDIDFLSKGSYGLTLKTFIVRQIPESLKESTSWDIRLSKKSNVHYYANKLTGVSTFEVPEDIGEKPEYLPKINYYKKISPDETFGKPVVNLVLKLVLICNTKKRFQLNPREMISNVFEDDFTNEINIQTDIYFKTINYLQPLCPGIVYSEIIKDKTDIKTFLGLINNKCDVELQPLIIELNKICAINPDVSIGLIGMECASDYSTLGQALNIFRKSNETIAIIRGCAQYALLKLATDTGYSHNDFHNNNILLVSSTNYFNEGTIQPMLIDFGRAVKIPPDILSKIKEHIKNKNYVDALSLLCDKSYAHEFLTSLEHVGSHYGWVCGDYNLSQDDYLQIADRELQSRNIQITKANLTQPPDKKYRLKNISDYEKTYPKPTKLPPIINELIERMYIKREKAIDNNIKVMNDLHDSNNMYPLIPVSDSIKGQLYKGFIGGKKRKKRKTKTNKKHKKFTRKFQNKK